MLQVFSVAELIVHPHKARRHAAPRDGVVERRHTNCGRRSARGRWAAATAQAQRTSRSAAATAGSSEILPTTASADDAARPPLSRRRELAAEAPHRDAAARGAVREEERDAPEHDDAAPVAAHVVEKRRRRPPRDNGARAAGAFQERGHVLRCLEVGVVLELAGRARAASTAARRVAPAWRRRR